MSIDTAIEFERCRRDPHYFIFDSKHLKTKDEHDPLSPIKPVPDHIYLRMVVDCLMLGSHLIKVDDAKYALQYGIGREFLEFVSRTGILFIEKSRDLFITNIICCFIHWRAKFHKYQTIMVQSKNEEDAANLVYMKDIDIGRISFQEYHLPEHLKTVDLKRNGSYCNVYWPNGSRVRGIAEGGSIIRSEHPSMVFSDESAFQDEFDTSFGAALPTVQGGGFYLAVSSAEPGSFEQIVQPNEDKAPTKIQGFTYRVSQGSTPVLRIHYSAHPERRPGTVAGEAWKEDTAMRYPGGVKSPKWKKEQEIDYGAFSGAKLIPDWEIWQYNGKIVIPSFHATGYRIYGSYDHGWRNPACYLVHGCDGDGNLVTLWEFHASYVPAHKIAEIIKGKSVWLDDGRHFEGNPYAGEEIRKRADPSMWAEDVPQNDGPNKSTVDIFRKCKVFFDEGERGGDTTVAEWLIGHFWKQPEQPLYRITNNCRKLIWEIGQQRFKQVSEKVAINRDQPEQLVDKDNHAWDALKMFLKDFPPALAKAKKQAPPASLEWWKKQMQRQARGLSVGSYRIPVAHS